MYETEEEIEFNGSYDPAGRPLTGYVTRKVKKPNEKGYCVYDESCYALASYQGANILLNEWDERERLILYRLDLYVTTESCWGGMSEFTITSRWSQVVLSVPAWSIEISWPSVPKFFGALCEATGYMGPRWESEGV